jgi:hypothetical protein
MLAIKDLISLPKFDYDECHLKDLTCTTKEDDKGKLTVEKITLDKQEFCPTNRFWDSLCSKFGFGPSIYKYFTHKETFNRISQVCKDDQIRLTIQTTPSKNENTNGWIPKLLAATSTNAPIITGNEIVMLMNRLDAEKISYSDGIITSRHKPNTIMDFDIGGDMHQTKLALDTPIDGYGRPNIYLELLRLICENGVVGYTPAFKSSVIIGNIGGMDILERAMSSYSNENGFTAMRTRILTAQKSWASVFECVKLAKALWKLQPDDFKPEVLMTVESPKPNEHRNRLVSRLYEACGDLRAIYGVAQLESLSEKRMRQLPSKATVYDLICFSSEIATHQLLSDAAKAMNSFVGSLLGGDIFDLENSCEEFGTFADFLDPISVKAKEISETPVLGRGVIN